MNRKSRFVHFFMLVALIANMFGPLVSLPVVSAEDLVDSDSEPEVSYDTSIEDDGESNSEPEPQEVVQVPEPVLTPVAPGNPYLDARQCVDGTGFTHAVRANTEPAGISYEVADLGNGTVQVKARIANAEVYTWNHDAIANSSWSLIDNTAIYTVTLEPCPQPIVEEPAEPETPEPAKPEQTEPEPTDSEPADTDQAEPETTETEPTDTELTEPVEPADPAPTDKSEPEKIESPATVQKQNTEAKTTLVLVAPVDPKFDDKVCSDVTATFKSVVPSETTGLDYVISPVSEDGTFTISATLQADFGWDETTLAASNWNLDSLTGIATFIGTSEPCEQSMLIAPMSLPGAVEISASSFQAMKPGDNQWRSSLQPGPSLVCFQSTDFRVTIQPPAAGTYYVVFQFDFQASTGVGWGDPVQSTLAVSPAANVVATDMDQDYGGNPLRTRVDVQVSAGGTYTIQFSVPLECGPPWGTSNNLHAAVVTGGSQTIPGNNVVVLIPVIPAQPTFTESVCANDGSGPTAPVLVKPTNSTNPPITYSNVTTTPSGNTVTFSYTATTSSPFFFPTTGLGDNYTYVSGTQVNYSRTFTLATCTPVVFPAITITLAGCVDGVTTPPRVTGSSSGSGLSIQGIEVNPGSSSVSEENLESGDAFQGTGPWTVRLAVELSSPDTYSWPAPASGPWPATINPSQGENAWQYNSTHNYAYLTFDVGVGNPCAASDFPTVSVSTAVCVGPGQAVATLTVTPGELGGIDLTSVAAGGTSISANQDGSYTLSGGASIALTFTIQEDHAWPATFPNPLPNLPNGAWSGTGATRSYTFTAPNTGCPTAGFPGVNFKNAVCVGGNPVAQVTSGYSNTMKVVSYSYGDPAVVVSNPPAENATWEIPFGNTITIIVEPVSGYWLPSGNEWNSNWTNQQAQTLYKWTRIGNTEQAQLVVTLQTNIDCSAEISVEKSGNGPIVRGEDAVFTITVTNEHATSTAHNVVLTDELPAGYVWSVGGTNAGNCDPLDDGTGTLSCNFGNLGPDDSRTITLTAPTSAETTTVCGSSINNIASVSADNAEGDEDGAVIVVNCAAATPTFSLSTAVCVTPGVTEATLTIGDDADGLTLTNLTIDAEQVAVAPSVVVPGGVDVVLTFTLASGYVWPNTLPGLGLGGTWGIPSGTTVTYTFSIDGLDCSADVSVLKEGNGTISAGQNAIFEIAVTNDHETNIAYSVVLTDEVPAGYVWDVTGADANDCDPLVNGTGTLTCNFGNLAPGATRTITLTAPTGAVDLEECPTVIENSATVSADNDSNPDNNVASDEIEVLCIPILPSINADPWVCETGVRSGANTFTVDIGEGFTLAYVTVNGATANDTEGNGVYTLPTGEGTYSVEVHAELLEGYVEPGDDPDIWYEDRIGLWIFRFSVDVNPCDPDVSIEKNVVNEGEGSGPGGAFQPGDTVDYLITITNTGEGIANDVAVKDVLPAGVQFVQSSIAVTGDVDDDHDCAYVEEDHEIECTGIDVPYQTGSGDESQPGVVTIAYSITIPQNGTVCGEIENSATFTLDGEISDPVVETVDVLCTPVVEFDKVKEPGSGPNEGGSGGTAWNIIVVNDGNVPVSGTIIDADLTAGLNWQYAVHEQVHVPGTVPPLFHEGVSCGVIGDAADPDAGAWRCTFTNLPPKMQVRIAFYVPGWEGAPPYDHALLCGDISNRATLSWYTTNPDSATRVVAADDFFVPCPGVDVAKVAEPFEGTLYEDDKIDFTITVTNIGNIPLTDVEVEDDVVTGTQANIDVLGNVATTSWGADPAVAVSYNPSSGIITIAGSIPPQGVVTIPVEYTVTQDDLDHGTVTNCALTESDGNAENNCAEVPNLDQQDFAFSKTSESASVAPGVDDPAVIEFIIELENTGNVTIANATITDELALPTGAEWIIAITSGETWVVSEAGQDLAFPLAIENLPPGQKVTVSMSYTIDADDIELPDSEWCRPFENTAGLTGSFANEVEIEDSDDASVLVNCSGLTIEKSSSQAEQDALVPGDALTYEIVVKNVGNIPLYNVTVTDAVPDTLIIDNVTSSADSENYPLCGTTAATGNFITCFFFQIEPDQEITITVETSVPDIGEITWEQCQSPLENQAVILGTFQVDEPTLLTRLSSITPPGADIPSDWVYNSIDCATGISIVKTETGVQMDLAGPVGRVDAGDTITYSFLVTNTSDVTLYNIQLTELVPGVEFDDPAMATIAELGPRQTNEDIDHVITATYVITQDDIENGTFLNEVEVTGNPDQENPDPNDDVTDDDDERTPITRVPGVDLVKSGPVEPVVPGTQFQYTLTVTNTGNVNLSVALTDLIPAGLTGWSVDETDGLLCGFIGRLLLCANPTVAPNQTVSVIINVTAPAAPGTSVCDTGITNYAGVGGASRGGAVADTDDVHTALACQPLLEIGKAGQDTAVQPGEDIVFTITVTNSGTYYAENVSLTDNLPAGLAGLEWTWAPEELCERVGDNIVCEIEHLPAHQNNVVEITLTATTNAQNPVCGEYTNQVGSTTGSREGLRYADVEIVCVPLYSVGKSSDYEDVDENEELSRGDIITYTITITNDGNVMLEGLTLEDIFSGENSLEWTVPEDFDGTTIPNIDVDSSFVLQATYEVTQLDVDTGSIQNCAFVSHTFEASEQTGEDCARDPIPQHPGVTVEKEASELDMTVVAPDTRVDEGDQITYTFTVTNTGNVTLTNIVLTDLLIVEGDWGEGENVIASLAPEEVVTRTAIYTIPQSAIDIGVVENCVDISAEPPTIEDSEEPSARQVAIAQDEENSANWPPQGHCIQTDIPQEPDIEIVKSGAVLPGEDGRVDAGDVIEYTFTVTNIGNITLVDVVVADPIEGLEWVSDPSIGIMEPGDVVILTATYLVPQAMIDAGEVYNCAGVDAFGSVVTAPLSFAAMQADEDTALVTDEDCITTPLDQGPGIDLEKTGTLSLGDDDTVTVGDVIGYEFTVTNTGNSTLVDLVVTDPLPGLTWDGDNTIASLAPGESVTLSATYAVTAADLEAGTVRNCAEVVSGSQGPAAEDCVDTAVPYEPEEVSPTPTPTAPVEEVTPTPTAPVEEVIPTATVPVDEVTPTPTVPAEEGTATPTAESVKDLPNTGHGGVVATTSILWAAAMLSVVVLGVGAIGVRRYR